MNLKKETEKVWNFWKYQSLVEYPSSLCPPGAGASSGGPEGRSCERVSGKMRIYSTYMARTSFSVSGAGSAGFE